MLFIHQSFLVGPVSKADKVPSKSFTLQGAVRLQQFRELGLLSDNAVESLAIDDDDRDTLTRVEVLFEFLQRD